MEKIMEPFGKRLKELRETQQLRQVDMAHFMN